MAASVTDKFTLASSGSRPTPTTLTATLASGSSPGTATCAALTGWPTTTAVYFCIYTINTSGAKVAGSQTDWVGVVSGTTITNLALKAGTNSGYSVGAVVEASPVAGWADALSAGLTAQHNQDGTHANITATGLSIPSGTIALPSASISQAALPLGSVVQMVAATYNAATTGTTQLPYDDTIPQNTEGDQYMTATITPKATTNRLLIEAVVKLSHSAASAINLTAALFQDSTANAIAADWQVSPNAGYGMRLLVAHEMAAGTISATTFKVRAGADVAGTTTFNGASGTRRLGGVVLSTLKIIEVKA